MLIHSSQLDMVSRLLSKSPILKTHKEARSAWEDIKEKDIYNKIYFLGSHLSISPGFCAVVFNSRLDTVKDAFSILIFQGCLIQQDRVYKSILAVPIISPNKEEDEGFCELTDYAAIAELKWRNSRIKKITR